MRWVQVDADMIRWDCDWIIYMDGRESDDYILSVTPTFWLRS
jgi:hypothetical protein